MTPLESSGASWRGARRRAALLGAIVLAGLGAGGARATTLFGLVDTGELFESTDGTTWSVRSALPADDAVGLVAVSSSADFYLASEHGIVYRSTDGGFFWNAVAAVPAPDVRAITASSDGTVFLATRTGAVFSNAGGSFEAVGAIDAPDIVSFARLGVDAFVLARTGAIYRSSDEGASWTIASLLPTSSAVAITALGGRLYAMTAEGDVAASEDLAASWTFVGTLSQVGMTSLLATTDRLYASTGAGEVASSLDGAGWGWQGAINQLTVRAMAHDSPALGVDEPSAPRPLEFLAPHPNPARRAAQLSFDLLAPTVVSVEVFDVVGRSVDRPIDGERLPAGRTVRAWNASSVAAGVYFLRARIGDREEGRSIVLVGDP